MYKTSWGKVGEEILKKHPKITQMFDMLKYPKVPKYQLKPLISLKLKNQSTHPHNPKAINSSYTLQNQSIQTNFLHPYKKYNHRNKQKTACN